MFLCDNKNWATDFLDMENYFLAFLVLYGHIICYRGSSVHIFDLSLLYVERTADVILFGLCKLLMGNFYFLFLLILHFTEYFACYGSVWQ